MTYSHAVASLGKHATQVRNLLHTAQDSIDEALKLLDFRKEELSRLQRLKVVVSELFDETAHA